MENKAIICLGDSLTEGDYGIFGVRGTANVKKENYPHFLSLLTGLEVRNYGKCGFRAAQYLDYYKSGEVDLCGAGLVIIMLGTNGGFSDVEQTEDNLAFLSLLENIKRDAPRAKIAICTPPHATVNTEYSNHGYMPQILRARAFLRRVAGELGIPVIETALCPDFCEENEKIMQPNDGLHFSELGYRTLAKFIFDDIKNKGLI